MREDVEDKLDAGDNQEAFVKHTFIVLQWEQKKMSLELLALFFVCFVVSPYLAECHLEKPGVLLDLGELGEVVGRHIVLKGNAN